MTHQPRYHGTDENTDAGVREPLTARQRWMRLLVIAIVAALFLLVVILHPHPRPRHERLTRRQPLLFPQASAARPTGASS